MGQPLQARDLGLGLGLMPRPDASNHASRRTWARGIVFSCASCFALSAMSQLARGIPSEADRLSSVRKVISTLSMRQLADPVAQDSPRDAAFCRRMLDDLLRGSGFRPVEPIAVLQHAYPIQNADRPMAERQEDRLPEPQRRQAQTAARALGPLNAGIQRCAAADAGGDAQRAEVLFNAFGAGAGQPPYRVYAVPRDVAPFPPATMAYWSEFSPELGSGRTGYEWVDLGNCERVGSMPALTDSTLLTQDPEGQQAALATYEGHLVTWSTQRPIGFLAYVAPKPPRAAALTCYWTAVPVPSLDR